MKNVKNQNYLAVFICIMLFFSSCSKDSDLFLETVLDSSDEELQEIVESNEIAQEILESRSTNFLPKNDAYLQSGKGYNQDIIRLEKNRRTSYLMFDLSPIDSINGKITKAIFQFTIESDFGDGSIIIYQAQSSDWEEESLSAQNAPKLDDEIGFISKKYNDGETQSIELDYSKIDAEVFTLVLQHQDGNDLAFASKEHATQPAPKLVVSYAVPEGSKEIEIEEDTESNDQVEQATADSNEAPIAVIEVSTTTGKAPLEVDFSGNNSIDDKSITEYHYDFKDGSFSSEVSPTHIFALPGTYEVEFTVTDEEGLTGIERITINVQNENSSNEPAEMEYPSNAVFASSFGFNSSDATQAIKDAINSNNSYIVIDKQSSDWIVGPLHFYDLSNKTIVFEPGVVLQAKNGAFPPSHRLLQFAYADNIEIIGYGATFKMNKSEYTSGEQRHTLSIVNSSNIVVKGLTLRDSGGDGIYISRFNDGDYCENILVEDVTSTNNKRQGMSVISVDGLVVRNSSFTNTSGKLPGAGVDFEPEAIEDRLVSIIFDGCTFTGNDGPGILFALSKTSANSLPIDATFNNTYVSSNFSTSNPTAYPSEIDLGMSSTNNLNPITGNIVFNDLRVENSKWSAIWSKKTLEAYHVTVKNAIIKNVSTHSNLAAIHVGLLSYGNYSSANMGGYTFENVLIDYDGVDASLELFGPSHGNWNLRSMTGEIKVKSPQGIRFEDNLNKLANTNSSSVNLTIVEN
jgi:PKD repeat protein